MVHTHFQAEGYRVDSCHTIDGLFSLELADYDLLIIDLDIENNAGIDIVEQVKQRRDTVHLGVIACSVKMAPTTIINALSAGADDYLLKPFSIRELLARANSVLRRSLFSNKKTHKWGN